MKAITKKVGAIVLALCMCMALCVTAFAASSDDTQFTITVNPAYSEETYTAYKIFDVTYSDKDSEGNISYSYTIESDSAWYSTVSNSGLFTLTQVSGTSTYTVVVKDGVTGEQIAAALTPVPEDAVAAATATQTFDDNADGSSGSGSVTLDVTTSGAGYYFVTTTLGSVVSLDTTSPSATIQDKNPAPTLTKEVTNESHTGTYEGEDGEGNEGAGENGQDTAQVGDVLEFEIKITNAAHKSALCLHDYTTDGLTYNGSEHISVYLNTVSASTKVSSDWYTIQDSECEDGCDFEIVFSAEWLDALSDTDVIIITYEAVVNEEAVTINNNDAFLTYGVGGHSVVVETETDVFGFDLKKVDGNGNALDGATFTLTNSNNIEIQFVVSTDEYNNTTYTVYDSDEHEQGYTDYTTQIVVGSASIFGLDAGTYTLTETEAPDGYNKLTSAITITIAKNGTVSMTYNGSEVTCANGTITVVNNAGSELPSTGGIGTTIFYIAGAVLICGAAVVLVTRRRMAH